MTMLSPDQTLPDTRLQDQLLHQLRHGRAAFRGLSEAGTNAKNAVLRELAQTLRDHQADIVAANERDQQLAQDKQISASMLDRMTLNADRIEGIAASVEAVAVLPDPVGQVISEIVRDDGMSIKRVRVPLGLVAVIYESRPNVTIDAACLCFKSGNAVMLRGGSEAQHSNAILCCLFQQCLKNNSFSEFLVQRVLDQDRALVGGLLQAQGLVDVVVPRGGKSLVARVMNEARVPVFAHLEGIVHVYVDKAADPQMATSLIANAKMRRTSICGAAETVLLHKEFSRTGVQAIVDRLIDQGCAIRGDAALQALDRRIVPAEESDFGCEFLSPIIAMKYVDNQAAAEAHIAEHGSQHTDVIITADKQAAQQFFSRVDSAIVMHNASSQFADGGEFGMGAEIGISTGRMHARGPVGLEQLTTFHYQVRGHGHVRPV